MNPRQKYTSQLTNIILVGDQSSIQDFVTKAQLASQFNYGNTACTKMTPGFDFVGTKLNNTHFNLWDISDLCDENNNNHMMLIHYLKPAAAFVYLNDDTDIIAYFERLRKKDYCIAIDFKIFKNNPVTCLSNIKALQTGDKNKHEHHIRQTAALIISANRYDSTSALANLPSDVINEISKIGYAHTYQATFFKKLPTYIQLENEHTEPTPSHASPCNTL